MKITINSSDISGMIIWMKRKGKENIKNDSDYTGFDISKTKDDS